MSEIFEIIPIAASAIVAWVALIVSVYGARTGRRALRLAESKAARESALLVAYLVDATSQVEESGRLIQITATISNPSDLPNTVARAELHIAHVAGGQVLTTTIIPPVAPGPNTPEAATVMLPPLKIDPHGTVAGVLNFRVPTGLVDRSNVRGYALQVTDAQNTNVMLDVLYIREG